MQTLHTQTAPAEVQLSEGQKISDQARKELPSKIHRATPTDDREAALRISMAPSWVFRLFLDAESRAFQRGYAKGRADLAAESWEQSRVIVHNAARSVDVMAARAKTDAGRIE